MKIGPGVSELWGVENRPLSLTRPVAYTTACTTVQAVICWTVHVNVYSMLAVVTQSRFSALGWPLVRKVIKMSGWLNILHSEKRVENRGLWAKWLNLPVIYGQVRGLKCSYVHSYTEYRTTDQSLFLHCCGNFEAPKKRPRNEGICFYWLQDTSVL